MNLFDLGLDRLESHSYSDDDKEKIINGAIALYEYIFGALLGAELSYLQNVLFRYLAQLMMVIPGATIETLIDIVENPEKARQHIRKLDPVARRFFEIQFFSPSFDDTRQRIAMRLWYVMSDKALARMFTATHNKLNLYEAMNRGSLILINTAKEHLKQEGCTLFGRFFISLILQATQERAAIPDQNQRKPTFVYIDEAHDYLDEDVEMLLVTARKYRVGLTIAHQTLGQLDRSLRQTVMASTAIKLAGGVSEEDARAFAKEMRCEPDFIMERQKEAKWTNFACFVKNQMDQPISLYVPFGEMEQWPQMTDEEPLGLRKRNRERVAVEAKPQPKLIVTQTENEDDLI